MASVVNVCTVNVLNNPSKFSDGFKLEITFEVYEPLLDDLEWTLVYVGSAESDDYDQQLDSILVGPLGEGRHKFIFETGGPDPSKIPESEIVGVTVLLLKCSYKEQEFINIGWFVANEYTDPELQEEPPAVPVLDKLQRTVCSDDVRVTTFAIKWHEADEFEQTEGVELVDEGDPLCVTQEQVCATEEDGTQTNESITKSMEYLEIEEEQATCANDEDMPKQTKQSDDSPLGDVTNESLPSLTD